MCGGTYVCFQATCQQHQQPYHLLRSPANCMSSRINRKCNKQSQEKKIYPTNAWERQKIVCSFGTLRFAQLFWAFAVATELTGEGNTHYSDNIFPYADIYFRTCVLVFVFALCVCVCVKANFASSFLQFFARFTICTLSCFELHFYVCVVGCEKSEKLRKTHIGFHTSPVTLCEADRSER